MSHARLVGLSAAALLSVGVLWSARAQEEALPSNTGAQLVKALEAQIDALNGESPEGVMALFHSQAPELKAHRSGLVAMFRSYDLRYTLDSHHYVGLDEPYAYIRVLQTTQGAKLRPSRTEQLFVFKREGREWKFWTSVVLDKRILRPRPRQPR